MGNGLSVKITKEKFKEEKDTNKKLDMLFDVMQEQQVTCRETVYKYNGHFAECDDLVDACHQMMEMVKGDINQVKEEVSLVKKKVSSVETPLQMTRSRKKEIALGAGIGTPAGITLWEVIKYFLEWLKHLA